MLDLKNKFTSYTKAHTPLLGFMGLIVLAVCLLLFNNLNSNQAIGATAAKVQFKGEYRIGDGRWQPVIEGEHISSTKGDVTLRGNLHIYTPDGEYIGVLGGRIMIAFYADHLNLTFYEDGVKNHITDLENLMFGHSACGVDWSVHTFVSDGTQPFEIVISNPHKFGNENAIDEMLSSVSICGNIDFERDVMASGKYQRNTGLLFIVVAFVLLGSALFSALLNIQNNRLMWMLGAVILFAGIYLTYSAPGVSFWSEIVSINTTLLSLSIMFYMLLISGLITFLLKDLKKTAYITTTVLGAVNGLFIILPIIKGLNFYDFLLPWAVAQSVANIIYVVCLLKEFISLRENRSWVHIGMVFLLISFEVDVFATAMGWWKGGLVSKYVFFVLFLIALFIMLRIIPEGIKDARNARELELQRSRLEAEKNIMEAKLKDSRISLMLSQIQPHFIYNTLGTIERMCLKDPEKAFDLVRNFSLYLRGNFSELDSVTPIRFAEELKHVEYYVNIEKVRFPDMDIKYNVETTDFVIPALSVQPLVENAIKHGLMRLESGGTVMIHSYETPTHFCVEVKDDGVGFDINMPVDAKKHVGLRNIKERLKEMVNGQLIIESEKNVGTRAIIMIPKEVTV